MYVGGGEGAEEVAFGAMTVVAALLECKCFKVKFNQDLQDCHSHVLLILNP